MTLNLTSDIAAALESLAAAQGLSVEAYLQLLVQRELPVRSEELATEEDSGMVTENGLRVYRTGRPLPAPVVDQAIRRSREERSKLILDNLS